MPHNELQRANLDLLMQLDRLLAEADRARTMRDRLLTVARQNIHRQTTQGANEPAVPVEAAHD